MDKYSEVQQTERASGAPIGLDGDVSRRWVPALNRFSAIALIVAGVGWAAATFLGVV